MVSRGHLVVWCVVVGAATARDVPTTQGTVRGRRGAYTGLPYAGPAAARNRFKAPRPPTRWEGVYQAVRKIKCPQPDGSGDENCLVLNIYVPQHDVSRPMSVLVHLHSGGFYKGWGSHDPPKRILSKGILVVTVNYRLGAFGFLYTGDDEAPGNAGIKDQVAALYWVHRNIAQFGGNPYDVTLYGTGAGASCVQFLVLSGVANDLFNKVILESGSALSPDAMTYDPLGAAKETAALLGIRTTDGTEEILNGYREMPVRQFDNVSFAFRPCLGSPSIYSVSKHSIIEDDPLETLTNNTNAMDIQMMFVFNTDGLSAISEYIDKNSTELFQLETIMPQNLDFSNNDMKMEIVDKIEHFYFNDFDTMNDIVRHYREFLTDTRVMYPVVKSAIMSAAKNSKNVYLMEFDNKFVLKQEEVTDVVKLDMVDYIFSHENQEHLNENSVEQLMTMISNFIMYGDPTPITTTLIPLIWQPVSAVAGYDKYVRSVNILRFGKTMTMSSELENRNRFVLWDTIYKNFYRKHIRDVMDEDIEVESEEI